MSEQDVEMLENQDEAPGTSGNDGTDDPSRGEKRKISQIMVDPITFEELPNAKRPTIDMDQDIKVKCLTILIIAYKKFIQLLCNFTKDESRRNFEIELFSSVSVSHQITSVIFTLHGIRRQQVSLTTSNMISKGLSRDYTINFRKGRYTITAKDAFNIWDTAVSNQQLVYKKFRDGDKTNWIGTMGPYLAFIGAFGLRLSELRIGHHAMPVSKSADGVIKKFPVSKYGLSGAHHVLLEGCTYPPERRSSMAQSVGPMTAFLCMLKSEGKYRAKWENAVKRSMAHIESIDDIIELTKRHNSPSEIADIVSLLGDILLITTSRQAQRMHLPLCMITYAYNMKDHGANFLKEFNISGRGAFYTYKVACQKRWTISGSMSSICASQIVFHCIMGTFKEDLSLLSQITDEKTWMTREKLGTSFKEMGSSEVQAVFQLPRMMVYSKLSSSNLTGLLSSVNSQVCVAPVFSGRREQDHNKEFFDHMSRRQVSQSAAKTMPQIHSSLTRTLDQLMSTVFSGQNSESSMGTVAWKEMDTLTMKEDGREIEKVFLCDGRFFMGNST